MANQKSLQLAQGNLNKVLKDLGKKESVDPCPVCENELYYDKELTKRCGILDMDNRITGWLCPHCKSEFDDEDNILKVLTGVSTRGET